MPSSPPVTSQQPVYTPGASSPPPQRPHSRHKHEPKAHHAPPAAPTTSFADMRGRLIVASSLLLSTFVFCVVGFHVIDPASGWIDAMYMTANVITTAGFRESVHLSRGGVVFTVFFLVFGAFAV